MTATILVVDDEPDLEALVLRSFRRQIRGELISFVFAHDGVEALRLIEQHPHVDLVVMDINMPRMDGLSLLAKLQEREDKKSAIIVSAYGDMSNIRTAMNRGAFDFLTKPIDFADLEATILKTLRHIEVLRDARHRQAEAERAHASLSRYFSPELAKRLAADGDDDDMQVIAVEAGGEVQHALELLLALGPHPHHGLAFAVEILAHVSELLDDGIDAVPELRTCEIFVDQLHLGGAKAINQEWGFVPSRRTC